MNQIWWGRRTSGFSIMDRSRELSRRCSWALTVRRNLNIAAPEAAREAEMGPFLLLPPWLALQARLTSMIPFVRNTIPSSNSISLLKVARF